MIRRLELVIVMEVVVVHGYVVVVNFIPGVIEHNKQDISENLPTNLEH